MKAIQVIEEIQSKAFKRHGFPVSLKAEAVLLYFKGLSLQKQRGAPLTRDLSMWVRSKGLQWNGYMRLWGRRMWFYKGFPRNAKYEIVYRWFASFIVIYTIMNLKS